MNKFEQHLINVLFEAADDKKEMEHRDYEEYDAMGHLSQEEKDRLAKLSPDEKGMTPEEVVKKNIKAKGGKREVERRAKRKMKAHMKDSKETRETGDIADIPLKDVPLPNQRRRRGDR